VSASRKESDGHAENTGYEFYDLYGKLMYDISTQRKIELSVGGGHSDNDYPHAWLNSAQPLAVRRSYTDDTQQKDYYSADLHYWGLSGESTRYWSHQIVVALDVRIASIGGHVFPLEIVSRGNWRHQRNLLLTRRQTSRDRKRQRHRFGAQALDPIIAAIAVCPKNASIIWWHASLVGRVP
jgi:hypothetical protein